MICLVRNAYNGDAVILEAIEYNGSLVNIISIPKIIVKFKSGITCNGAVVYTN